MNTAAPNDPATRRKLIAKVHVAKKQLGLDDHLYRAVLQRVTGRDSSKHLSAEQLDATLREFRRLGWSPKSATGKRPSANPQVRLIWALWNGMARSGCLRKPSRSALRTFVFNQTGVSDPEWLDAKQASNVIAALQAWEKRELAKVGAQ